MWTKERSDLQIFKVSWRNSATHTAFPQEQGPSATCRQKLWFARRQSGEQLDRHQHWMKVWPCMCKQGWYVQETWSNSSYLILVICEWILEDCLLHNQKKKKKKHTWGELNCKYDLENIMNGEKLNKGLVSFLLEQKQMRWCFKKLTIKTKGIQSLHFMWKQKM